MAKGVQAQLRIKLIAIDGRKELPAGADGARHQTRSDQAIADRLSFLIACAAYHGRPLLKFMASAILGVS